MDNPNDDIHNVDEFGNSFATIGAGTDQFGGISCGGFLKSDINRERDVNKPPSSPEELELLEYPPVFEDAIIARLFELDANYADDLEYACIPGPDTPSYNSNSYTAGLLRAAGLKAPFFPLIRVNPVTGFVEYPGWTKPVPADKFK